MESWIIGVWEKQILRWQSLRWQSLRWQILAMELFYLVTPTSDKCVAYNNNIYTILVWYGLYSRIVLSGNSGLYNECQFTHDWFYNWLGIIYVDHQAMDQFSPY